MFDLAEIEADLLPAEADARFIALAKAYEKLGNRKGAIDALEAAYEIDNSTTTLRQILALHEANGDAEAVEATTARLEEQLAAISRRRTRPEARRTRRGVGLRTKAEKEARVKAEKEARAKRAAE